MGDVIGTVEPKQVLSNPREVHVLVTGFGAFRTFTSNPSYLIAKSLPGTITLANPQATVHIHCHPDPIRVAYATVHTVTQEIIDKFKAEHGGQAPDIVLHIGLAGIREYYSIETFARREGYEVADVDGQKAAEYEELRRLKGYPEVLRTGDPPLGGIESPNPNKTACCHLKPRSPDDGLLETWQSFARSGEDLRLSTDAGRYLCEFIYYNSLAQAWAEGRGLSAVFLHVPSGDDPERIERGKDATVALIKSLVTCWNSESD